MSNDLQITVRANGSTTARLVLADGRRAIIDVDGSRRWQIAACEGRVWSQLAIEREPRRGRERPSRKVVHAVAAADGSVHVEWRRERGGRTLASGATDIDSAGAFSWRADSGDPVITTT